LISKTTEESTKHRAVLNFMVTLPVISVRKKSLCVNQPMSTAMPIVSITMLAKKGIM
jgi:hypothetical protein